MAKSILPNVTLPKIYLPKIATKRIIKKPVPIGATKNGKTKVISLGGRSSWRQTSKGITGMDERNMPTTKKPDMSNVKAKPTHRVHNAAGAKSGSTDTGDHHTKPAG